MSELSFKNRVVVVTGAGGGLGKAYATFFASRGAKVVVNDLGGSVSGDASGSSHRAADVVVNEIKTAGGTAVANYDSVEQGDQIIETAVKAFGRVDILINNAGILRDKTLARMSDQDFDLVNQVHVRGSYKCAKAAWPIMQKQEYGRIINTASAAGIYGNYGQANYSAAKFALHGFTLTLAREGAKKNIFCNTIAPVSASRMTESVMPPDLLAKVKPELVVPVVAYLCHESCTQNGVVLEAGAGFVSSLRWERSKGAHWKTDPTFTPAAVAAKWKEVTNFSGEVDHPASLADNDWLEHLKLAASSPPFSGDPKGLRYDGKVAVVTGAGAGLGRQYALMFARLGASVVVNDLGASFKGDGADTKAADVVVEEIRQLGGKAVGNYNSVEDGDKVIETAMKAFGRVDILVNNAGILRDISFARMSDSDWDLVWKVHMRGTYKCTKAAYDIMVKQKYGRIINTTSAVGLYGNFGQSNYSAAKLGIVGFSNTVAIEGAKNNILCNVVAPNAGTRMTATIMPAEMVEALKPDYVAPLTGYLAHESCTETGSLFEVGCGWAGKLRLQASKGVGFPINKPLLPEHIAAQFAEIVDFDHPSYPASINDSLSRAFANLTNVVQEKPIASPANKGSGPSIDVAGARKRQFAVDTFTYTERDVILYALGSGAKRFDLNFVYENAEEFVALPTYGVIPAFHAVMSSIDFGDFLPNYNPMMLLHGEQYLVLKKPIPTSGTLKSNSRIIDIQDKGSGAAVVIGTTTTDESGAVVVENEMTTFIRGMGGFAGGPQASPSRGNATAANNPPKRAPDAVVREKTSEEQAVLYRLSGDYNPLHVDPSMSKMGGFDVPILHGLCTLAYAGRHVLQKFCDNKPANFLAMKVRFASPVFPGETVETSMWKEGNKVIFQVKVVERNVVAISNAAVELADAAASANASAPSASLPSGSKVAVSGFASSVLFENIEQGLASMPSAQKKALVNKTKGVFQIDISNSAKKSQSWFVNLKEGEGSVGAGPAPGKSDVTIIISDNDFIQLSSGKADAQKLFMGGKLKLKGNMSLAMKLQDIFKAFPAQAAAGKASPGPAVSKLIVPGYQASQLIESLAAGISAMSEVDRKKQVQSVKAVFQFDISNGAKKVQSWWIDMKNGTGDVGVGAAPNKADCVISMDDKDFPDLASGKMDGQKAFMSGKLKLKGNMMLATKLATVLQAATPKGKI
ncbi:hypothetical protein SeLEV6574_g05450 [Synchytrium endobioticum]|uniref:Ketoreductase domain-containing protein n=1 Tax=Synchytrium endobioticum TaxID=286115 RepID=A0A507CU79_9FUNG|nr:hypothetical protein SeLEV6574_g05450 [Synchytrium endobioticum]